MHNFSDALTALPLWVALVIGQRAAIRRYTYGHGRAEDLAGLFVVAAIGLSGLAAGWESIRRLIDPASVHNLAWVAVAGVIGLAGNEAVALYRIRIGLHARTDGLTSLAVVLGAAGVAAGIPLADPIIGLAITIVILAVLRAAGRDVFRRLMDAVDPATIDDAEAALSALPGVRAVQRVRMRWIGHELHADVDLAIDDLPGAEAHRLATTPNANSPTPCRDFGPPPSTPTPNPDIANRPQAAHDGVPT